MRWAWPAAAQAICSPAYSRHAARSGCSARVAPSHSVSSTMPRSGATASVSPRITWSITTSEMTMGMRTWRVDASSTSTALTPKVTR